MTIVSGHIIQRGSPTSVSEVQSVIGSAASSVISLCQSANINRCARFKPYGFGGVLPEGVTLDIIASNNFGMLPSAVNLSSLPLSGNPTAEDLKGCAVLWGQWSPPTGSYENMQPCRLGDFRGYDHLAKADLASLDFANKWDASSAQALRDGWLRVSLHFAQGEDFRVYLSDFAYEGVNLDDMRLTLLVVRRYHNLNGYEYNRRWFAAQSAATLRVLRPSGEATVTLDLSKVEDSVIGTFSLNADSSQSDDHIVAVGFAPTITGIADQSGVPLLNDGGLPRLVSLNMYGSDFGSVRFFNMLGTAASSGATDKEFFDVHGGMQVSQSDAFGRTNVAWTVVDGQRGVAISIGGRFALMPYSDDNSEHGRFKIGISGFVEGGDDHITLDEYVIFTPAGIKDRYVDVNDGIVISGAETMTLDATAKMLDGVIFVPFDGDSAEVTVFCYAEGYPTGDQNHQYWPELIDAGGAANNDGRSWSVDLLNTTIAQ